MNEAPVLSRINIYPIKSLDGCSVGASDILACGALRFDRAWAIFDQKGAYVNGKAHAAIHRLRCETNLAERRLTLRDDGAGGRRAPSFALDAEPGDADASQAEAWLCDFFGFPVSLRINEDGGFPDDLDSPGPTLISLATLNVVAACFDLPLDEARRRFRANLEIDGAPPFWEDRLCGAGGAQVRFMLGGAVFDGVNPCQRCIVPTRDSRTGLADQGFVRKFTEMRRETLPESAPRDRFEHFYKLAINTRLGEAGVGALKVGDALAILETVGPGSVAPAE